MSVYCMYVYCICLYTVYMYVYCICSVYAYVFSAPPHSTPPGTVPCTTCFRCPGTGRWKWTTTRLRPSATGRERSTGCQQKQSTLEWDATQWVDVVHTETGCAVLCCAVSVCVVRVCHCSRCPVMPSVTLPPSTLTSLQTWTSSTDHPMWVLGCHVLFSGVDRRAMWQLRMGYGSCDKAVKWTVNVSLENV